MNPEIPSPQNQIEVSDLSEDGKLKFCTKVPGKDVWYFLHGSGVQVGDSFSVGKYIPEPEQGEDIVGLVGGLKSISRFVEDLETGIEIKDYFTKFLYRLVSAYEFVSKEGLNAFIEYYPQVQPLMDKFDIPNGATGEIMTIIDDSYWDGRYSNPEDKY